MALIISLLVLVYILSTAQCYQFTQMTMNHGDPEYPILSVISFIPIMNTIYALIVVFLVWTCM